ncbi:MAG TPA: OB-fold domain-containing protein [Nocardioidaceae bacterium]|nr:OB-fold domain-containing protein [Nocardioidaceae bacterium]
MSGIVSYGTYLPRHRLGDRVVASYDEDATTMAVAAARAAGGTPSSVWFATTSPPYLDKTNASILHAALGLPRDLFAADVFGAPRSAIAALRAASTSSGLAALADVRVGLPDSADEKAGGDGAAAFVFGETDTIADLLATASSTVEVLDRWRSPASANARGWEERFAAETLLPLIDDVKERALGEAGLEAADHVVLVSSSPGVRKAARRISTATSPIGHAGAADVGLALAAVLDDAAPGETILLISASDGVDALVFRTTELLPSRRPQPVSAQRAGIAVEYTRYLTWRGLLHREPPRRPEPEAPAGPPSARAAAWKYGFTGSTCTKCGFVHLPPARVCKSCGAADLMEPVSLSDASGTVATYTVDHLAYSLSPPVIQAVIDFDGGGRYTLEVADAQPDELAVGRRVSLSFRRLFTANDVHNYFWKARLL